VKKLGILMSSKQGLDMIIDCLMQVVVYKFALAEFSDWIRHWTDARRGVLAGSTAVTQAGEYLGPV
jgi:hypothetical protein